MKLQIEKYDKRGKIIGKIIASHIDASKNLTIISESSNNNLAEDLFITEKLEHYNTVSGLVTLYYKGGNFLEVRKLKVC